MRSELAFMRSIMGMTLAVMASTAQAEPVEVRSPELREIKVKSERAMGRLIVYTNYRSHKVVVDGAEYPLYLSDVGVPVTSNALHEVVVSNTNGAEKKYRVSVNPSQVLALYVDLGEEKKVEGKPADEKKEDKKPPDNKANTGYLSVTSETEAQVYVDGKLISSKTPVKKEEVKPGSHTVRVYFFDTRKFSKSREIYVGNGTSMSVYFPKT